VGCEGACAAARNPVRSAHADQHQFPAIAPDAVKGIQVVRQGFHDYSRGSIVKGTDPRGYDYYWFGLHGVEHTSGHDTDLEVVDDGFISVTPLQLDLTHRESLDVLRAAYS
jgi:5'-nucleotidase